MRKIVCALLFPISLFAQTRPMPYLVTLIREDGRAIPFQMTSSIEKGKRVWVITNASEKLRVDSILQKGDSLFVEMPFFDSRMRLKTGADGSMSGTWYKGTTSADATMPVVAMPGIKARFPPLRGKALRNITGRYAVTFIRPDGSPRKSVAEFVQKGDRVTGTFLNPSGDYRFLEGIVSGDSLMMSCFDGSHAYIFGARAEADGSLSNGIYGSGARYLEPWSAVRDANAKTDDAGVMMYLRDGYETLDFRFPDLDSSLVSIRDERFRNKVVILQIMGSWCPNCMDETAFLSEYYRNNRQRGVEVIGLAYEYSADFRKAEKSLRKFQQRYRVEYPILNTGVTTSDPLRTEKTLPQLTPIKAFPTTIFIGRDGKVKKIHPGFEGPGTGQHYEAYKKEFNATVDALLKQ